MSAAPRIGILGLGAYAPERVMTNDDWSQYVDTSDEWITERTGIKRRRIASDDQSTVDLSVEAGLRALTDAGVEPGEVDELIVATDTPEATSPDTAAFVQERLGLGEIPSYDLGGSGCAGWVLGLDLARSRAREGRRVLLVGVELLSRLIDWKDRSTCVLFGDAAGAALVGEGDRAARIVSATAGTDGSRSDILGRRVGGTRHPFTLEMAQRGEHVGVQMNGREVFKEAVRRMSAAVHDVLRRAGRALEEVALVVPHQANLRIIDAVGRKLRLPGGRVFVNVQDYGNTGSASVPLALRHALDQGRIAPGDLVVLTSFGAGFHWAAALLEFAPGR